MAGIQTAAPARRVDFDPLRWLWRVLTSVRFALGLIGFLAIAALLGVVIPQLPFQMRGNEAGVSAWLDLQETRFGFLTQPMWRLGLFDMFRSIWFVGGMAVLVVSVCVCTANRLAPVWRNVFSPQTRVPDEYFASESGATVLPVANPTAFVEGLRKRRYRVQETAAPDGTYVFADRFAWAQFATFISHLALILFLAGGLVTLVTSREQQIFVAEGDNGAPVFAPDDSDHMQVYVHDAIGRFDENDFPLEYRTVISVYRGGEEVVSGDTTVSHPLSYNGYKFHQAAYFPDGAALQVRDASGRLVYDEVLALTGTATTPHVLVTAADGRVLLDDAIVPTDFIGEASGTAVNVPGTGRSFWIGSIARDGAWQLILYETGSTTPVQRTLSPGESVDLDGMELRFAGMTGVPSVVFDGLPGGDEEGIAQISDGPSGKLLTVGPVQGRALTLSPNQPVTLGGYTYEFLGQREFSGLIVRRDPGSTVIWVATGTFLLGLALTFYTPRRRLWGKIAGGEAYFRGLGGRRQAIEKELSLVARSAASD